MHSIVIDTNVIIAALKSNLGASNKLLTLVGSKKFIINISTALILEYEGVIKRLFKKITITEINNFLDYICLESAHKKINYLWRPTLKDPNDELILELAVAAKANYIISYNKKDFLGIEKFGIKILTPKEFLQTIGEIK